MIRDPSDGSVKEKIEIGIPISEDTSILRAPISGLPTDNLKPDELARLERSRKWLSDYRVNPEQTTREIGETG